MKIQNFVKIFIWNIKILNTKDLIIQKRLIKLAIFSFLRPREPTGNLILWLLRK